MNYFELGIETKKNKLYVSEKTPLNNFLDHTTELLKDASLSDKVDFVTGFLKSAKTLHQYILIAELAMVEKSTKIWDIIIEEFTKLVKVDGNIEEWAFSFLNRILLDSNFNISVDTVDNLTWLIINYGRKEFIKKGTSSWWFEKISNENYFKTHRVEFEYTILKYAHLFDIKYCYWFFKYFATMDFYLTFIKNNQNDYAFEQVLEYMAMYAPFIIGLNSMIIETFLMDEKYKTPLSQSINGMHHLTTIMQNKKLVTSNTLKLLISFFKEKNVFPKQKKILWLQKLESFFESEEINIELYELTKLEKYMPAYTKDIFFIF